jgi:threonine dehydratase
MPRDHATLLDLAHAARLIQTFIQGMTKEAFLADLKTRSAVLHQVTVIGEAVTRMKLIFERHRLVIEGAAGVAVAAYVKTQARRRGQRVAIVICGGNINIGAFKRLVF